MSNTNATLTQFDSLIAADGPAALVVREHLIPAEGADAVFFPATFADIGYNIDYEKVESIKHNRDRERDFDKFNPRHNVCLIDSVGSQANRIEPMFKEEPYSALVPQIVIKAGDKEINLLDAGHRAGDALARCSALKDELNAAFQAILKNSNALPLAKIAPTSLVFGVWDSRDTQAKLPRLIASTIRAYDVRKLTRSATYIAPVDYVGEEVLSADDATKADGNAKNPLSATGFVNALANQTHGGVIADGGIRRDAVLALSALRLLNADTPENTVKLRRYILGLALVAFTKLPLAYYRQGTILTLDPDKPREFKAVGNDGSRADAAITHETALAFAQGAAKDFGVEHDTHKDVVAFDKVTAKKIIAEAKKGKK
jgi:CRISPR-associated protein Csb1